MSRSSGPRVATGGATASSPVVGKWTYRSFISDPNLATTPNNLLFGAGTLELSVTAPDDLAGKLGGPGWELTLIGKVNNGPPTSIRFTGKGAIGGEEWVYDYLGYAIPAWPNGVDQRPALVGTIIRTKAHSGGAAPAGVVAQWIAVKQDTLPTPAGNSVVPLVAKQAPEDNAEKHLRELETAWAAAVATNDPERIGKHLADDFLFVGAGGVLQNRRQHLDDFQSGLLKIDSVTIKDFTAHVFQGLAIVSTQAHVVGKIGERELKDDYRFMDSFIRSGDQWLAVARQQTKVAAAPPTADGRAAPLAEMQRAQKNLAAALEAAPFRQLRTLTATPRMDDLLPASQRLSLARAASREFTNPPLATPQPDGKILLEAKYEDNVLGTGTATPVTLHLRSYNGKLVGPTIRAKAGDTIKIKLVNNLPAETVPDPHGNGHHGWNTTNLHTHGLHVKPQANPASTVPAAVESDNVLLELTPSNTQEYAFEIPATHSAGTFWYHAHKHGSTSAQVSSGMAGALIISRTGMEEGLGNLDAVSEIGEAMKTVNGREREKIMVLQQCPFVVRTGKGVIELQDANAIFAPSGAGSWHRSGHSTTINGQLLPVITFTPGEVQRWRLIHSGFRELLKLQLEKDPDPAIGGSGPVHIDLHQIAVDGLPLSKRDPLQEIELYPGNRSDVLVKAPSQKGVYYLIDATSPASNSLFGEHEPLKFIAKVVIADETAISMSLPSNEAIAAHRLPSLTPPPLTDPVERAFYGITGDGFVIGRIDPGPTAPVAGSQFDPTVTRPLTRGKTQRWYIGTRNAVGINVAHPFHIHVNPFEVVAIRAPDGRNILPEPVWRDTIAMPQGYTIEFLTQYADFEGSFVQHCHILDHEDRGMMEKITIVPPGTPTPTPVAGKAPAAAQNLIGTSIPKPNGEPSVLFFVQGSLCPHCMSQLSTMAGGLNDRKLHVTVISASTEADLKEFPTVPFRLVADPELKLFKEYDAFDGNARHATIVRDGAGRELLRKVGDEPFMDTKVVLASFNRANPQFVVAVRNTDDTKDDYLTWSATPCQIRITNGMAGGPDVTVSLTNDPPATRPDGGDVRFATTLTAGQTATQESITLTLKQDGTPVDFFMAGSKASKLTRSSLSNGGRDAFIEVHQGGPTGPLLSEDTAVMVRVRKDFAKTNELERTEFLKAFAALRDMHDVTKDRFEPLVRMHKLAAMGRRPGYDQAHMSSGFFPWHRAFLLLLEREMQKSHPHVALPYWLMDQRPEHFAPNYLGNNVDPLSGPQSEVILATSNPLYGWDVRFDSLGKLVRAADDHVTLSINAHYQSGSDLETTAGGIYRSFRRLLEGDPHNVGHNTTGEWMAACVSSPADPVFWIFHCHHDHLWAHWQWNFSRFETSGSSQDHYFPEKAYSSMETVANRKNFPLGHHLKDKMWPWDETHGQQVMTDPYTTRPDTALSKFPKSTVDFIWPTQPASPTTGDMIDYWGLTAGKLSQGFAYDDTPFGVKVNPPVNLVRKAEMPDIHRDVFLDSGATEANRLKAAAAMSVHEPQSHAAFEAVLLDAKTSPAVKAKALSMLGKGTPDRAASHAITLLNSKSTDAFLSRSAMSELLRLHHVGELSEESRESIHAAIQQLANAEDRPTIRAEAVEGLAQMADPAAQPILEQMLRTPASSPLPLRRVVFLCRRYPKNFELIRPLLGSKQDEVVIASLQALANDPVSTPTRTQLVESRERAPTVRRAAIRSIMSTAPTALEPLVKVGLDPSELEETRAEAVAGIRVLVQRYKGDLGADRVRSAAKSLSTLNPVTTSELGKTILLTQETIREVLP